MTITQFIQNLLSDAQALIGSGFVVVGLVLACIVAIKGRGSVGSVIMALIVGGIVAALGVIVIATSQLVQKEFQDRNTAAIGHERPAIVAVSPFDPAAAVLS